MISNEMNAIIDNWGSRINQIFDEYKASSDASYAALQKDLTAIDERYNKKLAEIEREYTGEAS